MDGEFFKIIILAVIQGISEFLPISSSGHLAVLQQAFGFADAEENLFVAVILHAGTLGAIIVFYARDLWAVVARRQWHIVKLVVIGSLPLVVAVVLKKQLEATYANLWIVAACFAFTGFLLLVVHRSEEGDTTTEQMSWRQALVVGIMQCVAVLPGVSRSGSTITIATRLGIRKEDAARFSFFLGIPAIGGATALDVLDIIRGQAPELSSASGLIAGFFVSFLVGYVSLALLIRMLSSGKFSWFGYYVVGLAILIVAVKSFA